MYPHLKDCDLNQNIVVPSTYVVDTFKKIINSIEKSYWIRCKRNTGWILHNKNLYYIKTKTFRISQLCSGFFQKHIILNENSHSSSELKVAQTQIENNIYKVLGNLLKFLALGTASISQVDEKTKKESLKDAEKKSGHTPALALSKFNYPLPFSLTSKEQDGSLWFSKQKKNIQVSLYYLHLIYIKFIVLNLWKYFYLMK